MAWQRDAGSDSDYVVVEVRLSGVTASVQCWRPPVAKSKAVPVE